MTAVVMCHPTNGIIYLHLYIALPVTIAIITTPANETGDKKMSEQEINELKEKSVEELVSIIERTYLALRCVPGLNPEDVKYVAGIK